MAKAKSIQKENMSEGPIYYSIVLFIGWFFSILDINLARDGWASVKQFVLGMVTAGGALFFNKVLVPRYRMWRANRASKKRKDSDDSIPK